MGSHVEQTIEVFADNADTTHTEAKHTFFDLYNEQDVFPYVQSLGNLGYYVADFTGAIALGAIADIIENSDRKKPPVILELAAGYGLSMAGIKSKHGTEAIFNQILTTDRSDLTTAIAGDIKFMSTRMRPLPRFTSVGHDIANNALAYGKAMKYFDETICKNLEAPPSAACALSRAETALCARAKIVVATGAFSYITSLTLDRLFPTWEQTSPPVFLFFPLVATDMDAVIGYFEARGLDVYYEPALHWFPQRRCFDDAEARSMQVIEKGVLSAAGASEPPGVKTGYVHAAPLIAGPAGMSLRKVAKKWIENAAARN